VHAQDVRTSGTGPFYSLTVEKTLHATVLDAGQILNDAGPVFGPVPFVQVEQVRAGKLAALEAIFHPPVGDVFTGLDLAYHAGLGLGGVIGAAAGTRVLFPSVGAAYAAVDSTGSNQIRAEGVCSWHDSLFQDDALSCPRWEYLDLFLANLTNAIVSYSPWHSITAHRLYPPMTNRRPNRIES
jgi:hypothetical protein